jgi:hypothetical protein
MLRIILLTRLIADLTSVGVPGQLSYEHESLWA